VNEKLAAETLRIDHKAARAIRSQPTTSRMIRLRATLTGAKLRFVSKASAARAPSTPLVIAAPRKKIASIDQCITGTQITQIY
jgi:hypothetical protein